MVQPTLQKVMWMTMKYIIFRLCKDTLYILTTDKATMIGWSDMKLWIAFTANSWHGNNLFMKDLWTISYFSSIGSLPLQLSYKLAHTSTLTNTCEYVQFIHYCDHTNKALFFYHHTFVESLTRNMHLLHWSIVKKFIKFKNLTLHIIPFFSIDHPHIQ